MTIEHHPEVERELKEVRGFYEERSFGLGSQFIEEFERQIIRLAATATRWMVVQGDIRRVLMRRFPYVTYFRQAPTGRIRIAAVKHQRRHPMYGLQRV